MTAVSGRLDAANEIDDARFVPIAEAARSSRTRATVELLELLERRRDEHVHLIRHAKAKNRLDVGRSPTTSGR